jgi:hypothetical protein
LTLTGPISVGPFVTHSRICAWGPRLRPLGTESPESVRQRSNLAVLLTYAQCQERKSAILRLRASAKYGLRQAASSGQGNDHWSCSSSGQTWRFCASVFDVSMASRSTTEVQHSDHDCRGDGKQGVVVVAAASLPPADAATPSSTSPGLGTVSRH